MMNVACSFSYYLINFYVKYLPGSIFTNQIVNSLSESLANLLTFMIIKHLGIRIGFASSFFACAIACGCVMYAQGSSMEWLVPIGVLGAKAGI